MKSLKDSFILILITLELVLIISCKPVSDYKEVIEYLQNFDYLTQDEKFSLNKIIDNNESVKTDRRFKRALENLQKNGNIPITGKYDKNTALLIDTPRCGVSDKNIIGTRHKRYTLMSTKWPKTNLTWRFEHKNKEAFAKEENNIRRIIAEAFEVWEKDTIMKFTEAKEGEADIVISFEHPKHTQIDPYVFGSQTLGHAFQPGRGLGGDAHFNERIKWDFSVKYDSKPEDGKISFFAVALHELGHSLGLGHTREEDAVMYEFYSKSTSTLAEDDIRGMQHIYGVPPNRKYKPNNNKAKEDDTPPVWGQAPARPDKCNTSYDAIAMIDGEVVAFRRKYMFGPNMEVTEIKSRWRGLPSNLSRVDAVFQTSDKRVLFFINQDVYVFNGKILQSYKLTDFGMDQSVSRINAILRKSDNNQIYIFFGNSYLKFDEHKLKVFGIQTRITKAFRDVFEFDTGFTYNGTTYFIINEKSYEFDNENWILRRMKPELSANVFMNCNIVDLGDRFSDSVTDDFIDDEKSEFLPEAPNCHNNPEIPCNDQDNGTVKEKIRISLVVSYTVIGLMNFI